MNEEIHEIRDTFVKFLKDRSGWLGLSFVVLAVVLYASACGTGGSSAGEIVLEEEAGAAVSVPVSEEIAAAETWETAAGTGSEGTDSAYTNAAAAAAETGSAGASSGAAGEAALSEAGCTEEKEIVVFVCGAVRTAGVYTLPEDSRVYEAVEAAGGYDAEADEDYVNQAMRLSDGDRLRIPTREETASLSAAAGGAEEGTGAQGSAAGGAAGAGQFGISSGDAGSGLSASGSAISDADRTGGNTGDSGLININTADAAALMTLPGIGESKAQAIVSYRETNGAFKAKEDLMNVAGIKEGVYGKVADHICVE